MANICKEAIHAFQAPRAGHTGPSGAERLDLEMRLQLVGSESDLFRNREESREKGCLLILEEEEAEGGIGLA